MVTCTAISHRNQQPRTQRTVNLLPSELEKKCCVVLSIIQNCIILLNHSRLSCVRGLQPWPSSPTEAGIYASNPANLSKNYVMWLVAAHSNHCWISLFCGLQVPSCLTMLGINDCVLMYPANLSGECMYSPAVAHSSWGKLLWSYCVSQSPNNSWG